MVKGNGIQWLYTVTNAMLSLRRHRLLTAILVVISLLFTQLAVAGYVCPGTTSHAGMPCAEGMAKAMDPGQPGLCHAHCLADSQSADTYQLPTLPVQPAITADFPLLVVIAASAHAAPGHLQLQLLQRTTAPPLSVQNCCFRI